MDKVHCRGYKKTVPVHLDVVLHTKDGREVIGINKPYKEGHLSFVIKNIDVAPLFIITDGKGKEIDGAYVKLKGLGGKEDYFRMAGYEFRTLFYTDYYAMLKKGVQEVGDVPQVLKQLPRAFSQDQQPKEVIHPAVSITIFKDGILLGEGVIKIGESIAFGDHRLVFQDLTYWAEFYVVKEYGLGIIYTGFTLMVLALIIRFVFFRRDIRGVIEDGRLHIGGRGEFYTVVFEDEFRKLVAILKT